MPATTKAFEMRNDEGRGSPPRLVLSPLLSGVGTQFLHAAMLTVLLWVAAAWAMEWLP